MEGDVVEKEKRKREKKKRSERAQTLGISGPTYIPSGGRKSPSNKLEEVWGRNGQLLPDELNDQTLRQS